MKKHLFFIFGNLWLMISLALPEERAFDMLVALTFGLFLLIKYALKES